MKRWICLLIFLVGCSAPSPSGSEVKASWSVGLASPEAPVARDGRLFLRAFPAGTRDPARLFALDCASGKELWSAPIDNLEGTMRATSDGYLIVSGKVYAAATGKLISQHTPVVDEKTEKIAAWKRPESGRSSPSELCRNGLYFCFDQQSNLVAYDLGARRVAWKLALGQAHQPPWVRSIGDRLLVCGDQLSLVEAGSGKRVWQYALPAGKSFGKVSGNAGELVLVQVTELVGSSRVLNRSLVALKNGQELWRYSPVDSIVGVEQNQILIAGLGTSPATDFHAALEPSTGKELWRAKGYSAGVVFDGVIYRAHHDFQSDLNRDWTGDKRGTKQPGGIQLPEPVSSAYLEAARRDGPGWHSPVFPESEMAGPVLSGDFIYVCVLAQMKGGTSAVQAYKRPDR